MDKVRFNQDSEILAEDLNAVGVYSENAVKSLINDFINDGSTVIGLRVKAQALPGLAVYVEPGRIYQDGLQGELDGNSEVLVIQAPPGTGKRIDRVCAKYSAIEDMPETRNFIDVNTKQIKNVTTKTRVHGTIAFQVIAGTAAVSPAAPAVPEGWVGLAQVIVNAGVNAIQQTDIIDERPLNKRLVTHTHNGLADGAQIDHKSLLSKGINSHAQIDDHIAAAATQSFTNLGEYKGDLNQLERNTVCAVHLTNTQNNPEADYAYGTVITYGGCGSNGSWSQLYIPHNGTGQLWFRGGWDSDRRPWQQVVTTGQIGRAIGQIPALVDVGGKAGLPAVSGKLLTDISGVPVGGIIAFPGTKVPSGYLKCSGLPVGRATYPDLFATIGTMYGAGDGSSTFNLPDLRGEFIRGWDDARNVDAGRTLGSWQADATRPPGGYGFIRKSLAGEAKTANSSDAANSGIEPDIATTPHLGDAETRPRNIAMLYCIKAFDAPVNQAMVDVTKLANDVASLQNLVPAGTVIYVAANTAPSGYLKANGAAVSRADYARLFAAIGTTYGVGDTGTTFNLPDLRGEFIRSWDDGRGIDNGRQFGSKQRGTLVGGYDDDSASWNASRLQGGAHKFSGDFPFPGDYPEATGNMGYDYEAKVVPISGGVPASFYVVSRPRNLALLACIKY